MKLSQKLNTAFLTIIVLLIITAILVVNNLKNIEEKQNEVFDNRIVQIQIFDDIRDGLALRGLNARELIIENNETTKEKLITFSEQVETDIEKLLSMSDSDKMKNEMEEMKFYNETFNSELKKFINAIENNEQEKSIFILKNGIQEANLNIVAIANEMLIYQNKELSKIKNETEHSVNRTKEVLIIAVIITLLISFVIMLLIRKFIVKPINNLMVVAEEISKGNLSQKDLEIKSKDEIAQLSTVFNNMKKTLKTLIGSIQENSQELTASAEELLASSEEVRTSIEDVTLQLNQVAINSQNTKESANESAQSMEETAQGVQRIAESSQTLYFTSKESNETALKGNEIINNAKKQMEEINNSTILVEDLVSKLSKQVTEIESITKVITNITEQTNLLSLNAAIEAARAGEQGKGFAVVADEVRKLADNSKKSANAIDQLTKEIQKNTLNVEIAVSHTKEVVIEGVKLITNAGETFSKITDGSRVISEQIEDISSTTEELSASAEEVSASVGEIAISTNISSEKIKKISESMNEQTKTMEDVNSIADSLVNNASNLQDEVSKFKI